MSAELSITDAQVREAFDAASDWFADVVGRVPADAWTRPGLGEWTVRELAAHTARAFTTIELYLETAPDVVAVGGIVSYCRAAMASPGVNAAVAERGRQAGADLPADPEDLVATLRTMAEQARAIVAATADDAATGSAAGGMRFADYLSTRVFELTVHTADLCSALGFEDRPPESAARLVLVALAGLAAAGPLAAPAMQTLTGRAPWPDGATVLG